MFVVSVILFAIAALGGLVLAGMILTDKRFPALLPLIHGTIAALALVLMIAAMVSCAACNAHLTTSLILFILAACGGLIMASPYSPRNRKAFLSLMVGHGTSAVIAFLLLLCHVVS